MHLAILALLALTNPQDPPATLPAASVAWIEARAVPFTTPVAGHGFADLAPLAKIVGSARIVALGEPTHGTREAFQMKHRLLEHLVEQLGFSIFSIEANMPESYAVNEYVVEGKGDPKQLIAGMYFWTWNTEEVLAMVEWMRAWNVAHPDREPLQFTGFDMQTPKVAARIAREFVAVHAPDLSGEAEILEAASKLRHGGGAGFHSATGSFPVEAARGKKLVYLGWIRTEDVDGAVGLWWRCDTAAGVGAFDNMASQKIRGTRDWQRFELSLDVDADTQNINFGCLLSGTGVAWFDDLEVTLDGQRFEDPAFGFDFEGTGARCLAMHDTGDYQSGLVATKPHGGEHCLEIRHDAAAGPVPDARQTAAGIARFAAKLANRRSALTAATSAREVEWAIQNARVVQQCAGMFAASTRAANVRDECMADNVGWILDQNPGKKVVLWAHNGHVGRGIRQGMQWMGNYLERAFPGGMVVFGFATGSGTYTARDSGGGALRSDHVLQAPPADSIEAVLAAAGSDYLLDVRNAAASDAGSRWLMEQRPMRSIGAMAMAEQFFPCVVNETFDVLVWQAATTASVPLPK